MSHYKVVITDFGEPENTLEAEVFAASGLDIVLALNRHLLAQHTYVRSGKWGGAPSRLPGQVIGVVGLGRIGRQVPLKASVLGLKVVGYDPYLEPGAPYAPGIELTGLGDLLRRTSRCSSWITCSSPRTRPVGRAKRLYSFARRRPATHSRPWKAITPARL